MATKKPTVKKKAMPAKKAATKKPVTKKPMLADPEFQPVIKLDLGCGKRSENHLTRMSGYIGVDIADIEGVDVVHDLTQFPYPWADNSVDEIFNSHFIEHLTGEEQMKFFNECYRILKPGAKIVCIAPYYNSVRCWQDPTHKTAISEARFLYYNKQWREVNGLDHYPITCDFDFTYGYTLNPEIESRPEEWKAFAIKHYTNVINDIHVHLTKR